MYSWLWWLSSSALLLTGSCVSARFAPDQDQKTSSAVLDLDHTLAEVHVTRDGTTIESCRLYDIESESHKRKVLEELSLPRVNVTLPEMLRVIEECKVFSLNNTESSEEELPSPETPRKGGDNATDSKRPWAMVSGILPGTKWCGMGDIANSYEELGPRRELDRCCRAHDHCPVKLKAFRSGWGLVNFSLYTKSHCDCDRHFFNCLKETNTSISHVLGNFYFNIMQIQCMKPQRPMVCAEKIVPLEGKSQCIRWKYVPHQPKMSFVNPERRY